MDFTIANSKLLFCLRNLFEIKILCRFFKYYVIHLLRLLILKYSWKKFDLINSNERKEEVIKELKKNYESRIY